MELQLKRVLDRHGISLRELQRELVERNIDISHESLRKISQGYHMKRKNHNKIANEIERVLSSQKVTIKDLWAEAQEEEKEAGVMLKESTMEKFSLSEDPFSRELDDAKDVYWSRDLQSAKNLIIDSIEKGKIGIISGPWGCGKTTVLIEVREELRNREDIILSESLMANKDRLRVIDIVEDLIFMLSSGTENPRRSCNARYRQLWRLLEEQIKQGKKIAVIVDNAEDLHFQTINALRKMRDIFRIGRKPAFSLVFLGQPKLKAMIDRNPEVGSRGKMVFINSLDGRAADYLKFVLEREGRLDLFNDHAMQAINRKGGLDTPLLIKIFATNALNLAAELGFPEVNEEIINQIR